MANIIILPRSETVRYCHKPHKKPSVIISVSTPLYNYNKAPFRSSTNNVRAILRLYFEDTEIGAGRMSKNDAERIHSLLKRIDCGKTNIIVHCDAGVSRSAGIAAAILKYLTGDDTAIFNSGRYSPNMHCYRVTLSELFSNI